MKFNLQLGKFRFGFGEQPQAVRSFGGASVISRLNEDWLLPQTSADSELAPALKNLRFRARELERTNEYVQRYLDLIDNNVLGHCGVNLQMKITDPSGKMDVTANKIISDAWDKWKERKNCTPSGRQCWREVEGMVLRRAACDGGILIRLVKNWENEFKFAIQLIEIDQLDTDYSMRLQNGNEIRFGIEVDQWRRVVAYYILKNHPGDYQANARQRDRIPANEILHVYLATRPGQTVGHPWMASVMQALEHLGKYREAELVAARMEACKGYAIEQVTPDGWQGDTDANGSPSQEMSPGMALNLAPGQKYVPIQPTHPNTAHGEFVKASLRGIAGGLSVNYNSLANDLESVNYSSMRAGKLEEVEEYKSIQSWLIESLHTPVFEAWLEMALISGVIKSPNGTPLPVSKFEKFNSPCWKPRRWPWVDPLKDLQASVLAVEKGFKSRRSIIAEMGEDIEEVFQEQAEDNALAESLDLEFPTDVQEKETPEMPETETETTQIGRAHV